MMCWLSVKRCRADLDLHFLPRTVCPNTLGKYGNFENDFILSQLSLISNTGIHLDLLFYMSVSTFLFGYLGRSASKLFVSL